MNPMQRLMNLDLLPPSEVSFEFPLTQECEEAIINKIARLSVACFIKANRQKMIKLRLGGDKITQQVIDYWNKVENTDLTPQEAEELSLKYQELLTEKLHRSRSLSLKSYDFSRDPLGRAIEATRLDRKWQSILDCLRFDAKRSIDLRLCPEKHCFKLIIRRGGPSNF